MPFRIMDPEKNRTATLATFFTVGSARATIDGWLVRQERGGRKDISRELLERLVIVDAKEWGEWD